MSKTSVKSANESSFPLFFIGERVGDKHIRGREGEVVGFAIRTNGERLYKVINSDNGQGWLIDPYYIYPLDGYDHLKRVWEKQGQHNGEGIKVTL